MNILDLPNESLVDILYYSWSKNYVELFKTCKRFKTICYTFSFWRNIYQLHSWNYQYLLHFITKSSISNYIGHVSRKSSVTPNNNQQKDNKSLEDDILGQMVIIKTMIGDTKSTNNDETVLLDDMSILQLVYAKRINLRNVNLEHMSDLVDYINNRISGLNITRDGTRFKINDVFINVNDILYKDRIFIYRIGNTIYIRKNGNYCLEYSLNVDTTFIINNTNQYIILKRQFASKVTTRGRIVYSNPIVQEFRVLDLDQRVFCLDQRINSQYKEICFIGGNYLFMSCKHIIDNNLRMKMILESASSQNIQKDLKFRIWSLVDGKLIGDVNFKDSIHIYIAEDYKSNTKYTADETGQYIIQMVYHKDTDYTMVTAVSWRDDRRYIHIIEGDILCCKYGFGLVVQKDNSVSIYDIITGSLIDHVTFDELTPTNSHIHRNEVCRLVDIYSPDAFGLINNNITDKTTDVVNGNKEYCVNHIQKVGFKFPYNR